MEQTETEGIKMPWIVKAEPSRNCMSLHCCYPADYFPRRFHYKKEAIACAERAVKFGSKNVTIEKGK